jgi:hypothetical protein
MISCFQVSAFNLDLRQYNKVTRKEILTMAVQRRVDEMRRKGEGDVTGGYVSFSGVHYAAGAAASQVANYICDEDGAHGPVNNPGASIKPPTSALDAMAGWVLRTSTRPTWCSDVPTN